VERRTELRDERRGDPHDAKFVWKGPIPVRSKDLPAPETAGYVRDEEELQRRKALDQKWDAEQAQIQRREEERQEREKKAAQGEKDDAERRRCYVIARTAWFAEQLKVREVGHWYPGAEPSEWECDWARVADSETAKVQKAEAAKAVLERAQGEKRRRDWLEQHERELTGKSVVKPVRTREVKGQSERAVMWSARAEEERKKEERERERPPAPKAKETKREKKERKRRGK
jgi:hypothetical protein